ncbi:phosphoribosylanthranilate isomerase [Alkalihalobacillus pseudalcaliphilus]|uniref:phosphoribosylanthranilate isomerase n=1 Tax=Alkalihalobacillus pseudalcaliphilus TaxID=79884 RepID=UPI00064D8A2B|nr:phosphoribosylanthranilate isomerase [Alkalihalobacillus pseudalcaliphilus]KMK76433.1 N-(5'-phosphoribosyl)anthranilate isomerase [Alkalihalobacillus pseudalcaliphilus]
MLPKLKLCGNHSSQDLENTMKSEADYLGFVFAESKRKVTSEQVTKWLQKYTDEPIKQQLVALFVNEEIDVIKQTMEEVPFDIVQCHGSESPQYVEALRKKVKQPIWKVIHSNEQALTYMGSFAGLVDAFIIDYRHEGAWGGTGQRFDWGEIPLYQQEANKQQVPLFIAGGINNTNINQLLTFHVDGIDVSSGIEQDGFKSEQLIAELVERMRENEKHISRSKGALR